jgi:hypothetical protein
VKFILLHKTLYDDVTLFEVYECTINPCRPGFLPKGKVVHYTSVTLLLLSPPLQFVRW